MVVPAGALAVGAADAAGAGCWTVFSSLTLQAPNAIKRVAKTIMATLFTSLLLVSVARGPNGNRWVWFPAFRATRPRSACAGTISARWALLF